jgi:hypothetical protein
MERAMFAGGDESRNQTEQGTNFSENKQAWMDKTLNLGAYHTLSFMNHAIHIWQAPSIDELHSERED